MLVSHHLLVFFAVACDALAIRDSGPSSVCSTKMGPNTMRRVPTYWGPEVTKTATQTKCSIKTVRSTVTPKKETATVRTTKLSTTVVTANPAVRTATTTVTETATDTVTNSHTSVFTSTIVTTSVSTSTPIVPTPAGFTAIQDVIGFVPRDFEEDMDLSEKWRDEDNGHEVLHRLEARGSKVQCKAGPKGLESYPKQYPNRVDCTRTKWETTYKTTTKTATGTPMTLRPATTTVTSTITQAVTDTAYPPDVTSTVTESTTTVITEFTDVTVTSTEQTTSTVIDIVPASTTIYAACGSNNILQTANGGNAIGAYSFHAQGPLDQEIVTGISPYDCCVLCQTSKRACWGTWYYDSPQNPPEHRKKCGILVADLCVPDYERGQQYGTVRDTPLEEGFILSNGPCGVWENQGDFTVTG